MIRNKNTFQDLDMFRFIDASLLLDCHDHMFQHARFIDAPISHLPARWFRIVSVVDWRSDAKFDRRTSFSTLLLDWRSARNIGDRSHVCSWFESGIAIIFQIIFAPFAFHVAWTQYACCRAEAGRSREEASGGHVLVVFVFLFCVLWSGIPRDS